VETFFCFSRIISLLLRNPPPQGVGNPSCMERTRFLPEFSRFAGSGVGNNCQMEAHTTVNETLAP
jgi:hypothetical protein